MKIYPDCDYFGDRQDDEYSPQGDDCEFCYRYEICKNAFDNENESVVMT